MEKRLRRSLTNVRRRLQPLLVRQKGHSMDLIPSMKMITMIMGRIYVI